MKPNWFRETILLAIKASLSEIILVITLNKKIPSTMGKNLSMELASLDLGIKIKKIKLRLGSINL